MKKKILAKIKEDRGYNDLDRAQREAEKEQRAAEKSMAKKPDESEKSNLLKALYNKNHKKK